MKEVSVLGQHPVLDRDGDQHVRGVIPSVELSCDPCSFTHMYTIVCCLLFTLVLSHYTHSNETQLCWGLGALIKQTNKQKQRNN